MRLERKARRALRAFMLTRSLQMRLKSKMDAEDIPDAPIYQEMRAKYKKRGIQAAIVLIRKFGAEKTKELVDLQILEWKKSGAWRQDVWCKPDPEIVAIQEKLAKFRQDLESTPPTCDSWEKVSGQLTEAMSLLENYTVKFGEKLKVSA